MTRLPTTRMPRWFCLSYLLLVLAILPVYVALTPPGSFLWFSRLALILGLVAAWTSNARLASLLLVMVGLLELAWSLDFLAGLALSGNPPAGTVDYMFDPEVPLAARITSLYHLLLTPALFWMVWRLGYDTRAWRDTLGFGFSVLLVTRLLVDPTLNINWAHYPPWLPSDTDPSRLWLLGLMAALALTWWLSHRLLLWWVPNQRHLPKPEARSDV